MSAAKLEVSKYDGMSDFTIWSMKMMALLSAHELDIALEEEST